MEQVNKSVILSENVRGKSLKSYLNERSVSVMKLAKKFNRADPAPMAEKSILMMLFIGWLIVGSINTAFGQLIWSDEFDTGTSPNDAVWSYDLGAEGWGNRELQEYTDQAENVRIEDGNLVIAVQETVDGAGDRHFTSARVRTEHKLTFTYGRIEARIRIPNLADGLWPAFWTLGNSFGQVGWPSSGELDIMEMGSASAISDGVINRRVGSTAHWDDQGTYASFGESLDAESRLDDGFHIFSMDWTPSEITTYIDGELIWTFDIEENTCAACNVFHQPHFILLNMAVGGTYTGLLSSAQISAVTPAEMLIDYVRIYDNGSTVLGGTSLSGIGPGHSGSWYNEAQSGHGFSVEYGSAADGTPMVVVYWYTYDSLGNPMFMVGTGTPDGNTVLIKFDSPRGMEYGGFVPGDVVREDGGMATFEFTDTGNAVFSYTPSDFTSSTWGHVAVDSLPLVKLFGVPLSEINNAE